jgi:hypothetical protein
MRIALILSMAAALAGCSMGQDMSVSQAAIADFHQKLNAGQFAAITDGSGPEIKSGQSTDFNALLAAVRHKLGAFKSGSQQGFNDNYNNGDHTYSATYASVYETGPATENFVFRLNGGKAVLIGYHVQSAALMR